MRRASSPARSSSTPSAAWCSPTRGCPAEALPEDWPEGRARELFARLYRRLSPAANSFVAQVFASLDGPLPAATEATRRRLAGLAAPLTR